MSALWILQASIFNLYYGYMNWEKLKKTLEKNLAPPFHGRIKFHCSDFRKSAANPQGYETRAWITLDDVEFVVFPGNEAFQRFGAHFHDTTPTDCLRHPGIGADKRTPGLLLEKGEFSKQDFQVCCEQFLRLSASAALRDASPIIQMLALFDHRPGKAKIAGLAEDSLHPLPRAVLKLRKKLDQNQ